MATQKTPPTPPPPPPRGAAAQAPADTGRPPLPKTLLFSGKGIRGSAIGAECSFGLSAAGNVQIAVPFQIAAGQKATFYSVPDNFPFKPGEYGEIPEGTVVIYTKALTPDAAPYALEALRNAGWEGTLWESLQDGKAEGLGGTPAEPVLVKLEVSISEKNGQTGEWLRDADGNFRPWMSVEWVNKLGGFSFKKEAQVTDLQRLSKEMAVLLKSGAPRKAPTTAAAKPSATATSAAKPSASGPSAVAPVQEDPNQEPSETGDDDIPF